MRKTFVHVFFTTVLVAVFSVFVSAETEEIIEPQQNVEVVVLTVETENEDETEMADGWIENEEGRYYYEKGVPVTDWKVINGKWYYFYESGLLATDTWIGSYYVNAEGIWLENYQLPHWIKSGNLWWYRDADGSWPASEWRFIDGKWYYFNSDGYMVTGWQYLGGAWYYLDGNGAMCTGWQYLGGKWYYLDENGAMCTGWLFDGSTWYYLNGSGAMQTGWQYLGGAWYYLDGSGAMCTGWQYLGGDWYYLDGNGAMRTGWLLDGSTWYYLSGSGAMQTGWLLDGNTWYYLSGSGAMQTSKWIGDYYVQENGAMAVNTWIDGYYVDASGKWVSSSGADQVYTIDLGNGKTVTVTGHFDTVMANSIFNQLNSYRKANGLYELQRADSTLQTAVNVRGFETAYLFDHYRPNGGICFDIHPSSCAENIAMGYGSAEAVMNAWKNSYGHNMNMLNTMSSSVGISVFKQKVGNTYVNYFVQLFAW